MFVTNRTKKEAREAVATVAHAMAQSLTSGWGATVTVAEIYAASRETCSRLFIACGGDASMRWNIHPHPSTAAINRCPWSHAWNLYMPAMPLDARLSRQEANTIVGYVVHELGHALFTDFNVWNMATSEGLGHLVNGLEDIRIELALCQHGGSIANARALLEGLTEYTTAKALVKGWDILNPKSLPFTLYQVGAVTLLGYTVPSMPALVFPAPLQALINETMLRVSRSKNTQDVLDIARWLKAALGTLPATPREAPKPPKPPRQGEGLPQEGDEGQEAPSEGQDGEKGEDEGKGQDKGENAPSEGQEGDEEAHEGEGQDTGTGEGQEAPGEGQGERQDTSPRDGEGEEGEHGTGEGQGGLWDGSDAATDKPEVDLNDLGDRVSERNGQDGKTVSKENQKVTDYLNRAPCKVYRRKNLTNDARAAREVAAMLGTPARLRRDVSQALRSPETTQTLRNETRGRFDMRNAHRASIGAVNVFKRRQEEEGQETAVSFLVDMSSSMMGQNIRSAVSLALHLGDAAKACNCPFEVLGFLSPKSNPNGPTAGLLEVKAFRDPWQEARGFVGSMVYAATGGTSMMPAIPDVATRLRNQPGVTRRILIVLTDGEDGWPRASVRAAVKGAVAQGVEVIMLGVGTSVTHLGVPHVNVTSLASVAQDGLKALVEVLR